MDMLSRVISLVALCVCLGCAQQDAGKCWNSENVASCSDFVIRSITFRKNRSDVLLRDLSRPDYTKDGNVAALLWKDERCNVEPWQDAELLQVANETVGRVRLCPLPSTIRVEIIEQEYVTDGKKSRPTDYYTLWLTVEVFHDSVSCSERCFASTASARRYTCWGTASFTPLRANDLYALFSEALTNALAKCACGCGKP